MMALRNLGLNLAAAGVLASYKGRPLPRWLCTECWAFYGEPGKVKYACCETCFDVWLAECRLGVARQQRDLKRQKVEQRIEMGELPYGIR